MTYLSEHLSAGFMQPDSGPLPSEARLRVVPIFPSLRTAGAFPVVASLPPKIAIFRRERCDDRKCVCCSQATVWVRAWGKGYWPCFHAKSEKTNNSKLSSLTSFHEIGIYTLKTFLDQLFRFSNNYFLFWAEGVPVLLFCSLLRPLEQSTIGLGI